MAKQVETASVDAESLRDLIEGVRDIAESTKSRRQLSIMEIDPVSPWNPEGKRDRKRLKVKVYQNGVQLDPDRMTEEEIELFNQLKPGRYNHRKWEVIRRRDKSLDFRYPNKKIEDRMANSAAAGGLGIAGMLRLMITEHEAKMERKRAGHVEEEEDDDYDDY